MKIQGWARPYGRYVDVRNYRKDGDADWGNALRQAILFASAAGCDVWLPPDRKYVVSGDVIGDIRPKADNGEPT